MIIKLRTHEKIINRLLWSGLLAFFVLIYLLKLNTILSLDVPRELREMNMVAVASSFADGINPYSRDILMQTDPPAVTSLYGLAAPLFIAPFIWIFSFTGLSALQISELTAVLVEIAGVFFAYRIVKLKTGNGALAMAGSLLICSCYWRYAAFGGAFPDQWGITLGLLLTWLIERDDKKGKYRMWSYALILVVLFYVKQYFAFWVFGLMVFLFIRRGREIIKLIIWGAVLGLVSIPIVYTLMPMYFVMIFPVAQGSTENNGLWYSFSQIPEMALWAYKTCIPVAAACLVYLFINRKDDRYRGLVKFMKSISYEAWQAICVLPLCVLIARNGGTRFTYYLQLWWPYVLLAAVCALPVLAGFFFNKRPYVGTIVILAFLAVSLWDCKGLLINRQLSDVEKAQWREAYETLDEYRDGNVLVSPHLSAWCLDNGIPTGDYGQAEFNSPYSLNEYRKNRLWQTLFPEAGIIFDNSIRYNETVKARVVSGEYDCIAITDSGNYGLDGTILENAGYIKLKELDLCAANEILTTGYYVRSLKP